MANRFKANNLLVNILVKGDDIVFHTLQIKREQFSLSGKGCRHRSDEGVLEHNLFEHDGTIAVLMEGTCFSNLVNT